MEIQGNVWKDGKHWIAEVPALDAMTQGRTKKEALEVLKDLVQEMLLSYLKAKKDVSVADCKDGIIAVSAKEMNILLALVLIRQRERSGATVREAAERMGSNSPNAYAQYERGMTSVSFEKYEQLLSAANPKEKWRLRVV